MRPLLEAILIKPNTLCRESSTELQHGFAFYLVGVAYGTPETDGY